MPSLIHLNGPPGIGKSTLSALWADRHPGTLNLDLDLLHPLVGGWRDVAGSNYEVVRRLGLTMAATHLEGGRDVVLPQFLGKVPEVERFERVAQEVGADFREVVLLQGRAESIARHEDRADDSEWGRFNREVVAAHGGPDFLAEMYDRLLDTVARRPSAVVVASEPGQVEATYAAVEAALAER